MLTCIMGLTSNEDALQLSIDIMLGLSTMVVDAASLTIEILFASQASLAETQFDHMTVFTSDNPANLEA